MALHTAGAGRRVAADAAPRVPQDQVFQLLSTAVYMADEDPQRQHSLQQLRRMAPRLQEPPGPLNDVAIFSNRCITAHIYNSTYMAWTAPTLC